ncbi:MAG: AI-2E family transporter [Xanthobacteraceae bacterium]
MSLQRQITFWLAALAVLILAMWLLGEILLPFVAGLALAYLLNPLTNRLERLGIPRMVAALIIVSVVVLAIVLLILLVAPIIGAQLAAFIEDIPGYVRRLQTLLTDPSRPWLSKIVGERFISADNSVSDLVAQGAGFATSFLGKLWAGGRAVFSIFSLLVVTPVVAFYFIADWPRIIARLDRLVPRPYHATVVALARETDRAIAGFLRGQTLVCLILGLFYAAALSLVGLNFGLLIGLISGLISFIPYVGSITGLILSVGVAIAQFWPDWIWVVVVLAVFLFGQFLEGNVLVPKLVGNSVGLHPLWLMFALFAFGYLFGFVGLLLAVPLAAAIGVLVRFALRRYVESPLYTGEMR